MMLHRASYFFFLRVPKDFSLVLSKQGFLTFCERIPCERKEVFENKASWTPFHAKGFLARGKKWSCRFPSESSIMNSWQQKEVLPSEVTQHDLWWSSFRVYWETCLREMCPNKAYYHLHVVWTERNLSVGCVWTRLTNFHFGWYDKIVGVVRTSLLAIHHFLWKEIVSIGISRAMLHINLHFVGKARIASVGVARRVLLGKPPGGDKSASVGVHWRRLAGGNIQCRGRFKSASENSL